MYRIENRVALVTGSTAGLGRELAWQLCTMGAKIVLNGRDPEKLEKTAEEFREKGFDTTAVQGDVSSPADCQKIIDHCIGAFGQLDILVSNAGVSSGGLFSETTPETFRKVFDINTLGTIYITRAALPHIQETGGSIVFISSLAGLVGLPFSSLYCSSKMALTAIAQSLQVELADSDVHMGIVYAGFLENAPEKRVIGPNGELQSTGPRDSIRVQPMDRASNAIIRLIQKRKRKMVMSTMGRLSYAALRFAPWLMRIILIRSKRKARRIYEPRRDT